VQYRRLGRSGLEVSTVCLGTWDGPGRCAQNGGRAFAQRWLNLLDKAAMNGVNFIDTADVYENGRAERVVGRWLKTVDRRQVVIATKVGGRTWGGSNGEGCGRKHLREACEASLRRLGTDYIDLYQLHSPDPGTPIDETISALTALVNAGKILYWGLSNWPVPSALNLLEYTRASHTAVPISVQNRLNLLRFAEAPRYRKLTELGLLAYSPLAQGLLSDRQLNGAPAPGSRVAGDRFLRERLSSLQDRLHGLSGLARHKEMSLSQLGLAWLLHQPAVCSVVLGVSDRRQLAENVAAADVRLGQQDLREINEVIARTKTGRPSHASQVRS
jgi:aryl-alcohol dehydrogenase-like predicted oxidoreductase